ncbi:hypothetical protein [Clostridium sp. YIM B02551]|uniref:hypothetical protein n=1 Tax=Clostridium sp. YIM B02551 TaxID=2910679 RepID=UPI001EEA055E|nr:hypothetical protein [Clostridium sp. YIM B02551]
MQIRSKFYPYPVIADDSDSYIKSSFKTDALLVTEGYNMKFILKAKVENQSVQKMIDNEVIGYAHHIECPQTCFRTVVATSEEQFEYTVHDSKINGLVQVCSFLVALNDIPNYTNELFANDYKGFKFNIDKGCIMGVGNQINLRVNKVRDDLVNTSSIFSIVPNIDPNEVSVKVDLSKKSKIAIIIPEKSCNLYKNMSGMLDLQPIMHSMIIIPALMYVFEELKIAKNELYNFEDCRWFRSLRKTCKTFGLILDSDGLATIDIYQIAQQLMNTPLAGALEFLSGGDGRDI